MSAGSRDPVWDRLEAARPLIVEALSARGVVGVEYVVSFGTPRLGVVWLCTESDAERDLLGREAAASDDDVIREVPADEDAESRTRDALRRGGFADADLEHLRAVVVQSRETVDRDFEGSWFYALR